MWRRKVEEPVRVRDMTTEAEIGIMQCEKESIGRSGFKDGWGPQDKEFWKPLEVERCKKLYHLLLLLLLLSHFSCVRPCATPETAAHQAPRPWDSPGKNTGVGCHFLLQCMKVKSQSEVAQSCPTLNEPMDCSPPGSSIFSRQEYWNWVPLPSPVSSVRFSQREA